MKFWFQVAPELFNNTSIEACYYHALQLNRVVILEWLYENTELDVIHVDVALLNGHIDSLKWCKSKTMRGMRGTRDMKEKTLQLKYSITDYPEISKEWLQNVS